MDVGGLFEAHRSEIRRHIRKLVRDHDDQLIDDLEGEVWLRVVESADRYVDRGLTVRPWLYRVAQNVVLDRVRRSQVRPSTSLDRLVEAYGDHTAAPESAVEHVGNDEIADQLLALADPRQQDVLRARYLDDLSVTETAERLGLVSANVVKQVAHRGLARIRRHAPAEMLGEIAG